LNDRLLKKVVWGDLQMKGRTLAILLGVTMLLSSFLTVVAVDSKDSLIGQTMSGFIDKIGLNQQAGSSSGDQGTQSANMDKVNEVYRLIQDNYVENVDQQKLIDGAISGMLEALEDPYSVYMDPGSAKQFTDSINSSFQGIGATVTMESGKVTIESTIKGSPAEKAGLLPHDQITSVNEESLEGLDLYEAVLKIRGPKGTKARLQVNRPGLRDTMTVIIVRDDIPIETVYSEKIEKNGKTFGKIEVTQFSTNTGIHFMEELSKFEQQKVDGLIIDMRGNPGGLLNVVVDMGQKLIPDGGIILQVEDSNGQREVIKSTMEGKKPYPITVLIDKGSASASEILAGALKENGYTVVGQPSFGKGTVQNSVELGDQSQVKMTIAKWLTPSGNWIHKKGIEPTVKIEQPKYFFAVPIVVEGDQSIKFNENSDKVRNVQLIMEGLGFPTGRSDGFFDDKTKTAVSAFQKLHDLPVTGEIDAKTAQRMQEELVKKVKDPANDQQLQAAIQVLVQQTKN
jgi:carboxyl-terminal processing protease